LTAQHFFSGGGAGLEGAESWQSEYSGGATADASACRSIAGQKGWIKMAATNNRTSFAV